MNHNNTSKKILNTFKHQTQNSVNQNNSHNNSIQNNHIHFQNLNNHSQKIVDCYRILQPLGRGANGVVYKGLNIDTGSFVAMKQMHLGRSAIKIIQSQISFLKQLNHPNIIKYYDAVQKQSKIYLIIQYIQQGSLSQFVKRTPFPQNLVKIYIKQTIAGLKYLHQMGIVHRDIKGANLLLTKQGRVKLADFGVAVKINQAHKTLSSAGTPYWIAPQIIIGQCQISTKCDIWSLGCTVIQLLTGNPPFHDLLQFPALFKIVQSQHPPLPNNISENCKSFLLKCFVKKPQNRPSANQLAQHQWLNDGNYQQMQNGKNIVDKNLINSLFQAKQINFTQLIKVLHLSGNRKRIYSHPLIMRICQGTQHNLRLRFIEELIQKDWEAIKFLSQIGIFKKYLPQTVNSISKQVDLNLIGLIFRQICLLSCQHSDLSVFTYECLTPLKQMLIYGTNTKDKSLLQLIIGGLSQIINSQIIHPAHLLQIFSNQYLLNYLFMCYTTMVDIQEQQIALIILQIVSNAASLNNQEILILFKNQIKHLVRIDITLLINIQLCFYNIRILHLIAKNKQLSELMEINGSIYYTSEFLKTVFDGVNQNQIQKILPQLFKYVQVFISIDPNRKLQFFRHKGNLYLDKIVNKLSSHKKQSSIAKK